LGWIALDQGDIDAAEAAGQEALELARDEPWISAMALSQRYDAVLAALPAEGSTLTRANTLANMAWVVQQMGDDSQAAKLLREALALQGQLREVSGLSVTLENAAEYALLVDRPAVAARLLGAADALRVQLGIAIPPFNLDEHHALVVRIREVLGETPFAAASAQGADLLLDQVVAEADAVLAAAARGTE
jgi:Tfp pilus assembly protein PilF